MRPCSHRHWALAMGMRTLTTTPFPSSGIRFWTQRPRWTSCLRHGRSTNPTVSALSQSFRHTVDSIATTDSDLAESALLDASSTLEQPLTPARYCNVDPIEQLQVTQDCARLRKTSE